MKVLILGGTGRIGSEVSRALLERGAEVTTLCRSASSAANAEELGARPLKGDIVTPEQWTHELSSFDAVIHAAASFGVEMGAVDDRLVTHLIRRLSECEGTRRLVYTGGAWLFGNCTSLTGEAASYAPPAEWRWMAKNADIVAHSVGVEGLVVHPANVVDERMGFPSILLMEAQTSLEVRVPAPFSATWPLVGRRDLGELYALVLERGLSGEEYIGASEASVPLNRIAEAVARYVGRVGPAVHRPLSYWVEKYGSWASGYGLSQNLSAEKAKQLLGWEPQFKFST